MAKRIQQFYKYILEKHVRSDEAKILSRLPNGLRSDAVMYLFRRTLQKVLFFEKKSPQFISELVMLMKIEFHAPGDFLVVQGDLSTEMYFVGEGILGIREYEKKPNLSSKGRF